MSGESAGGPIGGRLSRLSGELDRDLVDGSSGSDDDVLVINGNAFTIT